MRLQLCSLLIAPLLSKAIIESGYVIANRMLYHVPDLNKGLSEARRVLKNGGPFYCATYVKAMRSV